MVIKRQTNLLNLTSPWFIYIIFKHFLIIDQIDLINSYLCIYIISVISFMNKLYSIIIIGIQHPHRESFAQAF